MVLNTISVRMGRRNRSFMYICSRNCIFDIIVIILIINIVFVVVVVMLQNCQVMVTSFDCCWCSGDIPQSSNCWSSCNLQGKIGAGRMEGDSGIIMEHVREDGM